MSKRSELIDQLVGSKTTLEIIDELRKLPIEGNELHVIPYGTKMYRLTIFCMDCKYYNRHWDQCEVSPKRCPPNKVYEGIYMGNGDSGLGSITFFSRDEAERYRKSE